MEPSVLALWKPVSPSHGIFPLRLFFGEPRFNEIPRRAVSSKGRFYKAQSRGQSWIRG